MPDLVDKSISAIFDIGGGRYIGHSLLFIVVIALALFLWKKKYGLAAIIGGFSHLALDLESEIPWFFPFKHYDFPESRFSFMHYLKTYLSWDGLGVELITVAIAGAIAIFCVWMYRKLYKHRAAKK